MVLDNHGIRKQSLVIYGLVMILDFDESVFLLITKWQCPFLILIKCNETKQIFINVFFIVYTVVFSNQYSKGGCKILL